MKEIVPEYEFSEEQLNLADALAAETGLERPRRTFCLRAALIRRKRCAAS